MTTSHRSKKLASVSPRALLLCPILAVAFALPLPQAAQAQTGAAQAPSAASGGVRGRVFDTASGEYVRNAEVRIEGTPIVAYSEDGGAFRLSGVPAGEVTVLVRYAGLQEARVAVTVAAGQTAVLDIELKAPIYAASGDETSAVEDIVVTAARGGQARP